MIDVHYKKQLKNFNLNARFSMPGKGITVLFGPSGAGKSSLLNLMAGLDNDTGQLETAQFSLKQIEYDNSETQLKLKPWLRRIGYVFQDARLFPNMTVEQNILFGHTRRDSDLNPEELIEKFKIDSLLQHYPSQLSGGQKQRVAMVRALLSNPDLLILDEPLAALDFQSRQELLPFIECIHKELTIPVIYVSHDIKEVLRLADYIVLMENGAVVAQGELAELCIDQPLLTQAEGASFVLQGEIEDYLSDEALLKVQCEEQIIWIAGKEKLTEKNIRVLIHAKDVSLCLQPPVNSSILNCVPVKVESVKETASGKYQVNALLGKQKLVAMITQRSLNKLDIYAGKDIYAQFKATALVK